MKQRDPSSILPDGRNYEFWETDPVWEKELFVNGSDLASSDDNDGSEGAPPGPSAGRHSLRRRVPGCVSTRERTGRASAPPGAGRTRTI